MKVISIIGILIIIIFVCGCISPTTPIITSTINTTIVNETINTTIVTSTLIDVPMADFTYNYLLEQKGILLNSYPPNSCEKIAKDYQYEYGGQLVFVAPYNTKTDQYIKGSYAGHWINVIIVNNTQIYIDYNLGSTYISKKEANIYMNYSMSNKFENIDISAKLFTYGEDSMPYPIIWHY